MMKALLKLDLQSISVIKLFSVHFYVQGHLQRKSSVVKVALGMKTLLNIKRSQKYFYNYLYIGNLSKIIYEISPYSKFLRYLLNTFGFGLISIFENSLHLLQFHTLQQIIKNIYFLDNIFSIPLEKYLSVENAHLQIVE